MKVENVRIYDLEESLIASGYPMRTMATQEQGLDEKDIKKSSWGAGKELDVDDLKEQAASFEELELSSDAGNGGG